jgi:arylsulfatase
MPKPIVYLIITALAVATQMTGSAAADAEWDRTVLPRPAQPFEGIANRTLEGSKAAFTHPVKAPPDAPNILLVLIDDAGVISRYHRKGRVRPWSSQD